MSEKWIALMYKWRLAIIAFFVLSVAAAIVPIWGLKIDNSVEIWFSQKDPGLKDYRDGLRTFGEWDWLVVEIEPKTGVYDAKFIADLRGVTQRIEALDNVTKVTSIANARGNFAQDGAIDYRALLPQEAGVADVNRLREMLEANVVYIDGIIKPKNENATLLLIQAANKFGEKQPYRIALVDQIHTVMQAAPEVARYAVVGTTNVNAELNRASRGDMFIFYPLVTLLVTVVGWFMFRNVRDLVVVYAVVVGAIAWSVGIMMGLGYELNMVTIMMPAILVTLSVANVVHLIVTFHSLRQEHPAWPLMGILDASLQRLWLPLFGAAITTIAGFLSLAYTKILPISLLGVFASLGISFVFVLTLTVAPVLLAMLWGDKARAGTMAAGRSPVIEAVQRRLDRLCDFTLRRPRKVIGAFVVFMLGCCVGLYWLEADSDYVDMFRDRTRVAQAYEQVEQAGFPTSSVTVLVRAPAGLEDPAAFRGLMAFEQQVGALPGVRKTLSPVGMIAEVDKAFTGERDAWAAHAGTYSRAAFAQLMLIAEGSGNDDLTDVLTQDHRQAQVFVFTDYMSGKETRVLADRIEAIARDTLPAGVAAKVTGVPVLWANMDGYLFASQLTSLGWLDVAIFVIMALLLRSMPFAAIALIVNILPIGAVLGLMSILGVKINMATTLIGGITLGIAVDDTIHFLANYRRAIMSGKDPATAIRDTVRHNGLAIFLASVLVAVGFSVMAFSNFVPTAEFGMFAAAGMLLALLTDLMLLPSLLTVLRPKVAINTKLVEATG